ncbi:MAG: acylneuraminate cytidylyltransferase family protein [Succinivibrio sp.]|nr:acylneuraminate cytidylyltransferase family protein [Succinivibrio sp.]
MRLLFTICARAGSKGIKNKNVSLFLGRPLAFYTLAVIKDFIENHPALDWDLAVNTDSQLLFEQCDKFGLPYTQIPRTEELAGDLVAKRDVIADTLRKMVKKSGQSYDFLLDLDLTSPLRTPDDVERLIAKAQSGVFDVVYSVTSARRNPYFNQVMRRPDGTVGLVVSGSNLVARQQTPEVYDMNASLYIYRPDYLESERTFASATQDFIEMPDTAVLDLDRPEDFELMQVIAAHLFTTGRFAFMEKHLT